MTFWNVLLIISLIITSNVFRSGDKKAKKALLIPSVITIGLAVFCFYKCYYVVDLSGERMTTPVKVVDNWFNETYYIPLQIDVDEVQVGWNGDKPIWGEGYSVIGFVDANTQKVVPCYSDDSSALGEGSVFYIDNSDYTFTAYVYKGDIVTSDIKISILDNIEKHWIDAGFYFICIIYGGYVFISTLKSLT